MPPPPDDLAVPPLDLMERVAVRKGTLAEMEADFVEGGRVRRDALCSALPVGWSFAGKSALDFGCGPGRMLRHFQTEAEESSFFACDLDANNIEWLHQHLAPPFKVFVNDEAPPLPFEDGSLDLIYATSMFTHLTDLWGQWLVELHRILKDDGLLFMTFLSCPMFADRFIRQPWTEDDVGLTMVRILPDQQGGSRVLMSEWWLRAHLGRGFDLVSITTQGWGQIPGRSGAGQGMLMLRRRAGPLLVEQLLAPEPDEPREWASAQFNLKLLREEILGLRAQAKAPSPQPRAGRRLLVRRRLAKLFPSQ